MQCKRVLAVAALSLAIASASPAGPSMATSPVQMVTPTTQTSSGENVRVSSAPARAVPVQPGSYRGRVTSSGSSGAEISLSVNRKRSMVAWRTTVTLFCYFDVFSPPVPTPVGLRFPRTKINSKGWIRRTVRMEDSTLRLRVLFKGGRATRGFVDYEGPACAGDFTWSAKRV